MTTIMLSVRNSKIRQVHAHVVPNGNGGSAILPTAASIDWHATGNDVFRVTFQDLTTQQWIWPFEGLDDGTFGPNNAPSLEVTGAGEARVLKSGAPATIKYEVAATNPNNADALDPVFIIRPTLASPVPDSGGILLGVVCAVLGAAVGAAATYAMMS
jgi:hypothetical protein